VPPAAFWGFVLLAICLILVAFIALSPDRKGNTATAPPARPTVWEVDARAVLVALVVLGMMTAVTASLAVCKHFRIALQWGAGLVAGVVLGTFVTYFVMLVVHYFLAVLEHARLH
jgi:hypothetical protein